MDLISLGGWETHKADRDVTIVPRHKRRMVLVEPFIRPASLGIFIAAFYGNGVFRRNVRGVGYSQ